MKSMYNFAKTTLIDLTTTDGGNRIVVHLSDSPKPSSIENFSRFMRANAVTDVFCFCNHDYDVVTFLNNGIEFHDLTFRDGMYPDDHTLKKFDEIMDVLLKKSNAGEIIINMQCQSGLGRAPTVLAYLMITRCGYNGIHSINEIRKKRRGSFNHRQLNWILGSKFKLRNKTEHKCCIM